MAGITRAGIASHRSWVLGSVVAVLAALAIAVSLTHPGSRPPVAADAMVMPSDGATMALIPPTRGIPAVKVCDQPFLRSPYSYHGRQGPYRSGTPGLPTYGKPGTAFPNATHGMVLPTGINNFASYQLAPDTVYYLLPGMHFGGFQANKGDAFVGGYWRKHASVLSGNYRNQSFGGQAIDSNSTDGNQPNVVIEYLIIEKYHPDMDAGAINQEANTGWIIRNNTIKLNVPGAGVILGAGNWLSRNCLTLNGQYGFQSTDTNGFGKDSLTDGPYGVTVTQNEISYNDTCDLSGLMNNPVIGWKDYNPVAEKYRNPLCGKVVGDGNQGGFKLWQTNGVTITRNNIHDNWGPGAWVDTNNANTTFTGNLFIRNEGPAIIEEISYNFAIVGNYMAGNDLIDGLNNAGFPQAAIYVSESGSDSLFGGVPACAEDLCSRQPAYPRHSVIRDNLLVNNGGSVFLWQSSNRYCSDGFDGPCTLVAGGASGPFTAENCKANLPTASVDTTTFTGEKTGAPQQDWWDGCLWRTSNVLITRNTIDFNPAHIFGCNTSSWPDCGAGGIFSQYGSPPNNRPGWTVPTQLTFFQNNAWSRNTYNGPSTFFAWNQGNGENPVNWTSWTGSTSNGDKCMSPGERQSGYCSGAFGQDTGSVYRFSPVS